MFSDPSRQLRWAEVQETDDPNLILGKKHARLMYVSNIPAMENTAAMAIGVDEPTQRIGGIWRGAGPIGACEYLRRVDLGQSLRANQLAALSFASAEIE